MTKKQIREQVKGIIPLMSNGYEIDTAVPYSTSNSIRVSNLIRAALISDMLPEAKEKYNIVISRKKYNVYFPDLVGVFHKDRQDWIKFYMVRKYGKFKVTRNGTDTVWVKRM